MLQPAAGEETDSDKNETIPGGRRRQDADIVVRGLPDRRQANTQSRPVAELADQP